MGNTEDCVGSLAEVIIIFIGHNDARSDKFFVFIGSDHQDTSPRKFTRIGIASDLSEIALTTSFTIVLGWVRN